MKVKMLEQTFLLGSGDAVTVRGSFNDLGNSTGNPDPLSDLNNDSIYTRVMSLPSTKDIQYKFWKTNRGGIEWEGADRFYTIPVSDASIAVDYFDRDSVANFPVFSVDASSLFFGSLTVGDSASLTVKVYNTGTVSLNISTIASTDANFTADAAAGAVPAGDSLTVTVKFKPTAAVLAGGFIVFTHDALGSPDSVAVNGTGLPVGPSPKFLTLTPDSVFAQDPAKDVGKSLKPAKRAKPGKPIVLRVIRAPARLYHVPR
jgi:hypothetical protein